MIKYIYLFTILLAASHVLEEYFTGWVKYAGNYIKNIKTGEFIVINILFLILVITGAVFVFFGIFFIFSLSIVFLIFINSWVHIVPSIVLRKYTPGLISAVFGYLPVSVFILVYHFIKEEMNFITMLFSFFIGLGLMIIPFAFQILTKKIVKKNNIL